MKLYAKEEIVRKYYKYSYEPFIQPILNSDGIIGQEDFAVESTATENNTHAWHLFSETMQTYGWSTKNVAYPHFYTMYSRKPLNIQRIEVTNYSTVGYFPKDWIIFGSNDNTSWVQLNSGTNNNNTASSVWNIDTNTNEYFNFYKIDFTGHLSGSGTYIRIGLFHLIGTQQTIQPASVDDYDFYKDVEVYKIPLINNKYYVSIQGV